MRNGNTGKRRKEVICLGIALLCGAVLTGILLVQRGMLVEARARQAGRELSREVLRFHVLADSDSQEDQQRKMEVKEALLDYMEAELPQEADLEETCAWVRDNLDNLERTAEDTLREAGCSDGARAELVRDYFPEKTYGDVTFPAGEYTALRICIGEGRGHNWWCCLYPSLCFTDAVTAYVPADEKEQMGRVLGEDEYEMITAYSDFKIRWFFFGGKD